MRTVCMVMLKAVRDVLGKDTEIVIENSIKKNFYCEIHKGKVEVTQELTDKIRKRMQEIIDADIRIEHYKLPHDTAVEKLEECGLDDKIRLYKYRNDSIVNLYCIEDYYDYLYGYMAPSTSYVELFDVEPYEN